jgi:protein-S-isoprenylcysteine O-methyltransferase Ste14
MNYAHGIVHILMTLVVYFGLPLLGWGLDDLAGFFAVPARAGFAISVGLSALLAAYQGMVIPEERGQAGKRVTRQTVFLLIFEILGMALLFWLGYSDRREIATLPADPPWRWVGLTLAILGGGIMFISAMNLGRQYSPEVTIQEGHRLVTHGLYRFIRHPRYLGLFILLLGFGLIFRSWAGAATSVAALAALIWRIKDEEKMMAREFGLEWEKYSRHTWRLLPGIW